MKQRTWDIKEWTDRPAQTKVVNLCCPQCGTDADLLCADIGPPIIATIGLRIIFDQGGYQPPANFLPETIRCRTCRRTFSSHEQEPIHVR